VGGIPVPPSDLPEKPESPEKKTEYFYAECRQRESLNLVLRYFQVGRAEIIPQIRWDAERLKKIVYIGSGKFMTHRGGLVGLHSLLGSARQVTASGMPLGETKGCQPGTEKSHGGWKAQALRCAAGEIR